MRLLFVLLFSASLFAGEWTINDFTIRGKQFTQSATGILQGNLNRIPSYRAPKGDELLLRRRLDMNNYGLYIGKAEALAYTNLSRFTKPAGMSMDKLLKMKFFKSEVPTGYNDVADIYFQGEYLYVENLVRIFYKENGIWKSLEVAQGEKPGVLEISSTPSGATVTIDGVVKGKTPYSFVMDAPTVEVEVSKSGYYSQSFTADAKPGAVKKFASSLKERVTFSSNVEPEKMLDTTIQDIDQALELLRSIEGVYKKEKGRESTALAEFEKSFPKLKPQGEFEYDHEFAKRKTEYEVKKQKALADAKINASAFNSSISLMNDHIDYLSSKLYDLYLPVNSMKLGRYEINENRFPVTISINQGAFQFTYKGYLMMNRDVAKLFKFSSDEKGLKLQYSKRKVKVSGKEYYIHYGGMNIPFQGKVYELSGDLTLPTSVVSNKDYKSYIQSEEKKIAQEKVIKNSLAFLKRKHQRGDELASILLADLYICKARESIYPSTWEEFITVNDFGEGILSKKHYYDHYISAFENERIDASFEASIKVLESCVRKNKSSHAMCYLGALNYNGWGFVKDSLKAYELLEKSAALGNSNAMVWLGLFANSRKDYKEALAWYQKSADLGDFLGICYTGILYQRGYGVMQDNNKALELYRQSAKMGCSEAMASIGYLYMNGIEVEKDYEKASVWYEKAAQRGNTHGMNGMAYLYKNGFHFQKNYKKAFEWTKASAQMRNDNAMNSLGWMYLNGQGVEKNVDTAVMWFRKSVENESVTGIMNIAYVYSQGLGVPKDEKKAFELYLDAANKGSIYSMFHLGKLYESGIGVRRSKGDSKKWYIKAAKLGNKDAIKVCEEKGFAI